MGHSASLILLRNKDQALSSGLFSKSGLGEMDSQIQAESFGGVLRIQKTLRPQLSYNLQAATDQLSDICFLRIKEACCFVYVKSYSNVASCNEQATSGSFLHLDPLKRELQPLRCLIFTIYMDHFLALE